MSDQPQDRSDVLCVTSYDVFLDITRGDQTFVSRAEIQFRCSAHGALPFADLGAASVRWATLNGQSVDVSAGWRDGRLELRPVRGQNVLAVEAEFAYATAAGDQLAGQGLYRVTDPAEGSGCVYAKAYRGGAARMYCCFDVPRLRAPINFSVRAPAGWSCLSNAPAVSRPPANRGGAWRFAPTAPIAPAVSSICAGPYTGASLSCERDAGPALPVSVLAMPSAAAQLQARRVFGLVREPLRHYERSLGVPFPYGKCDVLFVPGFPGLAFSAPGLIAIKEEALSPARAGEPSLYLATVIAHELSHAWLGGLASICRADHIEMWLVEALATYVSRTALAEIMPGAAPWAAAAEKAPPDDHYAANAAIIRQLEQLIGRDAVFRGLGSFLRQHAHADAGQDELVRCWSEQSGRDLRPWTAANLRPSEQ
jgi:aminopeptidase N